MRIRAIIFTALLISGCATLQVDRTHTSVPIWVTEGDSPLHTNAVPARLEPPLEQVWDLNSGAGFGQLSPLIVGDVLLVGTRKGEVLAVDLETGRRLGQTSFGESIEGTPVVNNGILYVPIAWGGYAVRAYNLSRSSSLWNQEGESVSAGLAVHGGNVIAADVAGVVRALSLDDGEVAWSAELASRAGVKATPVVAGDLIIVGDDAGRVTALNAADGSLHWSTDIKAPVYSSPAANESLVFVPTSRGALIALDITTGDVMWRYDAPSDEVYIAAPAVGEWEVVFGGSDGVVRSLDPEDGTEIWRTNVDAAVTAPPLITDNTIYVGTMRSRLLGLSREHGTQTWDTTLDGRIKSAFAAKGSRLVVLAEPRLVYLFEPAPEGYATREE